MSNLTLKYNTHPAFGTMDPILPQTLSACNGVIDVLVNNTSDNDIVTSLIEQGLLATDVDLQDLILEGSPREFFLTTKNLGAPLLRMTLQTLPSGKTSSDFVFDFMPGRPVIKERQAVPVPAITVIDYDDIWRVFLDLDWEGEVAMEYLYYGENCDMQFKTFWDAWKRASQLAQGIRDIGYYTHVHYGEDPV